MINDVKKIIIDTDPGIDDTMAIYFALNSPNLEVVGLTTVYGNTSNTQGTENALRILEISNNPNIPVHTGASKPLTTEYMGKGELPNAVCNILQYHGFEFLFISCEEVCLLEIHDGFHGLVKCVLALFYCVNKPTRCI